jgi:predicted nucleic acid-binding protein
VTELELLVRPIREADDREMEEIRTVLEGSGMQIMELDRGTAQTAAELRAMTMLPLADAAIVATALRSRCDAIVGNDRRCWERVSQLPYILLDDLVKERRR